MKSHRLSGKAYKDLDSTVILKTHRLSGKAYKDLDSTVVIVIVY